MKAYLEFYKRLIRITVFIIEVYFMLHVNKDHFSDLFLHSFFHPMKLSSPNCDALLRNFQSAIKLHGCKLPKFKAIFLALNPK